MGKLIRALRLLGLGVVVTAVFAANAALAEVPPLMNTQGMLRSAAGAPVADGPYDLTFALYPSQAAETSIWSEVISGVWICTNLE